MVAYHLPNAVSSTTPRHLFSSVAWMLSVERVLVRLMPDQNPFRQSVHFAPVEVILSFLQVEKIEKCQRESGTRIWSKNWFEVTRGTRDVLGEQIVLEKDKNETPPQMYIQDLGLKCHEPARYFLTEPAGSLLDYTGFMKSQPEEALYGGVKFLTSLKTMCLSYGVPA
jgi:hypothetical protein